MGWFLTKLNTVLPHDSPIMWPDIYLNELKTNVYIKTCKKMNEYRPNPVSSGLL
jgi:hypothetical protein